MGILRDAFATFKPDFARKEWEGVAITAAAVALWFFQRAAKWPRWSGGWLLRSLFVYVLIPFALHAYFSLEGARRRYAGVALASLVTGLLVARFALPRSGTEPWIVVAVGLALSAPLVAFSHPRELGVRLGDARRWLPLIAIGFAVTLAGIVAMAHTHSFLKSYPYVPLRPAAMGTFVFREALEVADMFAWEFFFRGFLLFSLAPRVGLVPAILVQTTLFACAHVNKPEIEFYASIGGGLLLGQLCYRVRSMMPAFVAHQAVFLSAEIAGAWVKLRR